MHDDQRLAEFADSYTPHKSDQLLLAAACAALGMQLDSDVGLQWFREKVGDLIKDDTLAHLSAVSADGKWSAKDVAEKWSNDEWHKLNPDHPIAYMRAALRNYSRFLDFLVNEQGPLVIVRRGAKMAVISKHTTPEMKARIQYELNAD